MKEFSYEEFKYHMDAIENLESFDDDINAVIGKHNYQIDIGFPTNIANTVCLLRYIMHDGENPNDGWGMINYFIHELDFGRKYAEKENERCIIAHFPNRRICAIIHNGGLLPKYLFEQRG